MGGRCDWWEVHSKKWWEVGDLSHKQVGDGRLRQYEIV